MIKSSIVLVLICFCVSFHSKSQMPSGGGGGTKLDSSKNFSFMPIPYINYSRSTGFALGVLPMAMYNLSKKDTVSPASVSGAMYMHTTNGTWFGMAFSKFYLKEDSYRVTVAAGTGNFNFQFYPDIPFAPEIVAYSTGATFLSLEVQREIIKNMYGGIGYVYADMATEFDVEGVPIDNTRLDGLRLVYSFDKRDDVYYPYKGSITNVQYSTFPDFMGNESVSNKIEIDYNKYHSFNKRDVVALRAFVGFGIGELDFNQQFIVGNTDIRGYAQGEFRGEQLYAMQGEYRWNITNKFGLVGFAGLATVFKGTNEANNGKLLPGAGGGFRVNVFPKNHMNIGMDAAVGVNDWGVEFKIGEAF